MPHDPALVQDTQAWLTRARRDLQVAEHDMNAAPPFLDAAVFHCQQAAEKALKAMLAWHDVPFRKTHDLAKIGKACLQIDATLQEMIDRASPLTEYAGSTDTRGSRQSRPAPRRRRRWLSPARSTKRFFLGCRRRCARESAAVPHSIVFCPFQETGLLAAKEVVKKW